MEYQTRKHLLFLEKGWKACKFLAESMLWKVLNNPDYPDYLNEDKQAKYEWAIKQLTVELHHLHNRLNVD